MINNLKFVYHYLRYSKLFDLEGMLREVGLTSDKENINKIRKLERKHSGRCFITATGPSLTSSDLELLQNEITFGVNSIFLMYEKTGWRPSYYVCTDAGYFQRIAKEYQIKMEDMSKGEKFLNIDSRRLANRINATNDTLYIPFTAWNRMYEFMAYGFQEKIYRGMYAFGTVTNIAIAIAMYMGYKEIYLIGADCSNLSKHFENVIEDKDKDEMFYFDLALTQKIGYRIMNREAMKRNIHIYNATRGGALEEFPRVTLEEIL